VKAPFLSRFTGCRFIPRVASVSVKLRPGPGSARTVLGVLSLLLGACTADVQRSGVAGGTGATSSATGGTGSSATGGSGNGSSSGGSGGSGAGMATGGSGNVTSTGGASGKAGSGGTGNAGGVPPVPDDCDPAARTSATPLRRLGRVEYLNTLRDLLEPSGLSAEVEAVASQTEQVPPDGENEHLFSGMDRRLTQRHVDAYYGVANALSERLTGNADSLEALAGACTSDAEPTEACVSDFLTSFGARAFRRPLTDAEVSRYLELRSAGTPTAEVFRGVVFTLLLSPDVLYHLEIRGEPTTAAPEVLALAGHEKASRLSYLFWQSMPDADLLARAAAGDLDTDQGYQEAVQRVFEDPRTRRTLSTFWGEWLGITGFAGFVQSAQFEAFADGVNANAALATAMMDETHALIDHFTWTTQGSYRDVLTSRLFLSESTELAELYGIDPWNGSGDPPSLPDAERSGLLTRAAMLVEGNAVTNPIKRGAFILKQMLCEEIDPPSDLPAEALALPMADPTLSTRERFEIKTSPSECRGCHSVINPLGFSLEVYDALGRYRSEENVYADDGELLSTMAVDPSVEVSLGEVITPVSTPIEFSEAIAATQAACQCLARQYFRFALRRDETVADACTVGAIRDQSIDGGSLSATLRSVALIPSFRERVMEDP
jgi:hypothetical protein